MTVTIRVGSAPGSVPVDVTSFVGRRHAMAEIKRALSTSHLVTLTGVGGIGKTRLALNVVQGLRRAFADGTCLVELDKVGDPSVVAEAVVTALGVTDVSSRDVETILTDYLANRKLLLVLDNCEHLLDACASLVARLLPVAPGLRVLATSREPLGINGEHVWPVPALSLPPEGATPAGGWGRQYEALTLFEERAAAAAPEFVLNEDNMAAAGRLCQRLDGLPLAIELAAARLRALTVDDILSRLEDRFLLLTTGNRAGPPRHQTLRAAIEWSYQLCTEHERTLWAKLSVFTGGFELAAAEEVCADEDSAADDVFTGVAGLVDKSVLVKTDTAGGSRYRMLETIRQYGRDHLSDADERAVRRRHADYFLRLAKRSAAEWFGPDQVEWLDRFRVEQPNVQTALEFCLTQPGQARIGLAMVGALSWYWGTCAVRDGRRWLDRALACDTELSPERAKALWVDGWVAADQGDVTHAFALLQESIEHAQELRDETTLGHAKCILGFAKWWFDKDPSQAARAFEQALAHHGNAGTVDEWTVKALGCLGVFVGDLGDTERGVALCQECIEVCEARGEKWARSWGLWHLAFVHWLRHEVPQVSARAKESIQLKRALDDQVGIAWCIEVLAWVAVAEHDTARAAVLFGITSVMWEQIGGCLAGWLVGQNISDQCKAQVGQALGQDAFDAALARGRDFTFDEAVPYALGERQDAPQSVSPDASELPELTRREREVATLIAKGMSNKDIAASLVVSQRTVESHVQNILTKLGFTSRTQIAVWVGRQQDIWE